MAYKAAAPCALLREHILLNPASFSTSANADADYWRETANLEGLPARGTHVHDNTAYSSQPNEDSWQTRLAGAGSNANTNANNRGGQLT